MRMKALGVALMVGFAAFTTFYWITDAPRRDASEVVDDEERIEFGRLVFLPDDTFTVIVAVTPDGFFQKVDEELVPLTTLDVFVNTYVSFENDSGSAVDVSGSGIEVFDETIEDGANIAVRFTSEGETEATVPGLEEPLVISAGPPHLQPYGANCARCHGVDGQGLIGPNLHSLILATKWSQTGGAQGLNNYVAWVITLGGVVVSGNVNSIMPAWGQDYGGTLTRQQIEALTAMIGGWAQETLDNPPPSPVEVPNTVEAGAEVYAAAGCVGCHGADLSGGVGPNIQGIGTSLVTDGLTTQTLDIEQMQADYDENPRAFLETWIRTSSVYNNGTPTGMPEFDETDIGDSQLQALITFLLEGDHTP
jgi:mono/diheme cytochrome c family protein